MKKAREATKANVLSGTPIPTDRPDKRQRGGKRSRPATTTKPLTLDDIGDFEIVYEP